MARMFPYFKYHPRPVETDMVLQRSGVCSCCGEKVEYLYADSPYLFDPDGPRDEDDLEPICPWCIADGSAAAKFGIQFNEVRPSQVKDEAAYQEVAFRTPGYIAWQEPEWLVHCEDFCAYLGRVGSKELAPLRDKMETVLTREAMKWRMEPDEFLKAVHKDGDMTGYLFQCLHCGTYQLYADAN